MSDLLDAQISMYPEILRRMAAGEHLASQQDETEKLAATLLAAEAMEAEQAAETPVEKKAIDLATLAVFGAGAAISPLKRGISKLLGNAEIPGEGAELIKSFRQIMQGQAETEALKRKMLMLGLGAAGAGALAVKALEGKKQDKAAADEAAEAKAEEKAEEKSEEKSEKKDEKSDEKKNLPPWLKGKGEKSDEKSEKKDEKSDEKKEDKDEDEKDSSDVAVSNIPSGKPTEKTGSPSARAVLGRLMKSFA